MNCYYRMYIFVSSGITRSKSVWFLAKEWNSNQNRQFPTGIRDQIYVGDVGITGAWDQRQRGLDYIQRIYVTFGCCITLSRTQRKKQKRGIETKGKCPTSLRRKRKELCIRNIQHGHGWPFFLSLSLLFFPSFVFCLISGFTPLFTLFSRVLTGGEARQSPYYVDYVDYVAESTQQSPWACISII